MFAVVRERAPGAGMPTDRMEEFRRFRAKQPGYQGALEVEYMEEMFSEFSERKTAIEIIERLQDIDPIGIGPQARTGSGRLFCGKRTLTGTGRAATVASGTGLVRRGTVVLAGHGIAARPDARPGSGAVLRWLQILAGSGPAPQGEGGRGRIALTVVVTGSGLAPQAVPGAGAVTLVLVGTGVAAGGTGAGSLAPGPVTLTGQPAAPATALGGGLVRHAPQILAGAPGADPEPPGAGAVVPGLVVLLGMSVGTGALAGSGSASDAWTYPDDGGASVPASDAEWTYPG